MAVAAGHEVVDDDADADLAIVNSCAVTAEAERDARKAIRRTAARKADVRTVVMGCASALPAGAATLRALPTVERVVAGADLQALADVLGADTSLAQTSWQRSARAVLRIQDGCDEHCTFCVTTLARGANRSRPPDALVREAQQLAEHHPEIVLTGTHIGTYGADIDSTLGALVETLVACVPAVRFRLSSVEATEVDERLAELLAAGATRVTPYLHAPLQSGSDRVLRRMGRHWYTADSYARSIERLCARRSVFGLGADVIVGFPGETEADFAATVSLVRQLPFTYLHVFPYSPRPGTSAPRLRDAVSPALARERAAVLRSISDEKAAAYQRGRDGSLADIVVTGGASEPTGMTEDFLTIALASARPRGDRFAARLVVKQGSLIAA